MARRRVTILTKAVDEVAYYGYFIESVGMPTSAKRFIDDCFEAFSKLANKKVTHRPCRHAPWQILGYRCVTFRKKYVIAYLETKSEIVICDFTLQKLLV